MYTGQVSNEAKNYSECRRNGAGMLTNLVHTDLIMNLGRTGSRQRGHQPDPSQFRLIERISHTDRLGWTELTEHKRHESRLEPSQTIENQGQRMGLRMREVRSHDWEEYSDECVADDPISDKTIHEFRLIKILPYKYAQDENLTSTSLRVDLVQT